MNMSVALKVIYAQTHQAVYNKHAQFFTSQSYLNKVIYKK